MTASKLELLIREINPETKDGRVMRENMRRIKQFMDDVASGAATLITYQNLPGTPQAFDGFYNVLVSVPNQTSFTLPEVSSDDTTVRMLVNGVGLTNGLHFTVVGTAVTFIPGVAGYQLETVNEFGQPDDITFYYMKP